MGIGSNPRTVKKFYLKDTVQLIFFENLVHVFKLNQTVYAEKLTNSIKSVDVIAERHFRNVELLGGLVDGHFVLIDTSDGLLQVLHGVILFVCCPSHRFSGSFGLGIHDS